MKDTKRTFTYYMTLALREAGVRVDHDNTSELDSIIDGIADAIDAAVAPLQARIEVLEAQLAEREEEAHV